MINLAEQRTTRKSLSTRDRRRVANYVELAAQWRHEGRPAREIAQLLRGVVAAVSNRIG